MPEAPETGEISGRRAIYEELRRRLLSRGPDGDGPLTERTVAREFSVCRLTARRALQELVRSGHLQVTPRRGYWPSSPLVGTKAPRIAYVHANLERPMERGSHYTDVISAVQWQVLRQGGTVISIGESDPPSGRLVERVQTEQVDGIILDCDGQEADAIADALGAPCVLINTPTASLKLDVLVQDNAAGGHLAARHCLDAGHRRIGWLGWQTGNPHARERLGGFLSAFAERGLPFDPAWAVLVERGSGRAGAERAVERLLALKPTAIVVLWTDLGAWSARYIRRAGLRIPDDIGLVTWGPEETFRANWWECSGAQAPLPDAILWKLGGMVDAALSRLAERMRNPLTLPARVLLPVRLARRGSCLKGSPVPGRAAGGIT
ncbi:MAG: substrate-binding domain-containing protein [Planctomycetota bacterium]